MMRQYTVRGIDILAGVLWVSAFGLWIWSSTLVGHESQPLGRLSLLVGMAAVSVTSWGMATWIVYVLRVEMRLGRLRDVSRRNDDRDII